MAQPEHRSAFFYGTLMAPQVLHRVLYGSTSPHASQLKALTIQPAILSNYTRHRVKHCDYPAILADVDQISSVRGTYVQGITAADQWRLDIFEGDQYERVKVRPKLLKANGQEGAVVDAETYVWIAPEEQLEKGEWDFEKFRKEKMSRWVGTSEEYQGELRPSIAEVDLAAENAKFRYNPTGGRLENGKITPKYGGSADGEEEVVQSAV